MTLKQKTNVKFYVKVDGKSATEILQTYSNNTMSLFSVLRMTELLEVHYKSGQPCTNTIPKDINRIWQLVHADHQNTVHDVADAVGITFGAAQVIIIDNLKMYLVAAKFVLPSVDSKPEGFSIIICKDLYRQVNDEPIFMPSIITGGENCVYGSNTETKQQSSQDC